ncbi:hypothetical protein SARC_03072 [Sphaeroforma arctica JP610]|uniref:Uncharacterized protein n=1 Tax=Sphaeroforma arctica JP610 TaxID=667725 RepID=A0A0L0G775_9EUKA|nr:hypothetical protein SARC_03072 [Sphaeroforma arctica JP610]KNC84731.1 hypothetical protein SARC_03072 [Sphaeroforma arctica JP610]|eukprot:XP_014158633.1 hypothetical protein SARC_03072 [Sphaeroforma arctica JP610]
MYYGQQGKVDAIKATKLPDGSDGHLSAAKVHTDRLLRECKRYHSNAYQATNTAAHSQTLSTVPPIDKHPKPDSSIPRQLNVMGQPEEKMERAGHVLVPIARCHQPHIALGNVQ